MKLKCNSSGNLTLLLSVTLYFAKEMPHCWNLDALLPGDKGTTFLIPRPGHTPYLNSHFTPYLSYMA